MLKVREWHNSISNTISYSGSMTVFGTVIPFSGSYTPTVGDGRMFWTHEKSRTWYTTPDWKATRKAVGWLPTLPMGEMFWYAKQGYPGSSWKLVSFSPFVFGSASGTAVVHMPLGVDQVGGIKYYPDLENLVRDAKIKALSKARDMKTNVAVFLGEGRQTVRMIAETANRLGRAYRHFRRGRFGRAAKELGINKPDKEFANHWLAYTYGWSPLLSDAKSLAELAAQQLGMGGRPPRWTVKASAKGSFSDTESNPGYTSDVFGVMDGYIHDYTLQLESHAGMLLTVEYTSSALAAQTGFGLYDPLLFAWELTPFSFVFDWFIDVGGWLESMSALQGLQVLDGFSSYTRSSQGIARTEKRTCGSGQWQNLGPNPTGLFNHRDYSRVPWFGGEVPALRTPLLDGLNARRLITSASLWRQRLRGDRLPGGYHP